MASLLLPLVSLLACAGAAALCFMLTRRISSRPWLWSFLAVVVYVAGIRGVLWAAYADLPSEDAAAHAYDRGDISMNEYESARAADHHARYVAFGVAFVCAALVGVAKRWTASAAPFPEPDPERQIAGKACAVCGKSIVSALDGVRLKENKGAVHKSCRARRKRSDETPRPRKNRSEPRPFS